MLWQARRGLVAGSGALAAGGSVTYATFDGVASNATLSNGNLTVTHSNTSVGGGRSTAQKNSGKFYFEVTVNSIAGNNSCIAVATAAATYSNFVTSGSNAALAFKISGSIWSNDIQQSHFLGDLAASDDIGVAIDLDNHQAWFRKAPSGEWNPTQIPVADPASNVGGVSISNYNATTLAPAVGFGGTGTAANEAFTANFGASAFSGAVPSGFTSGWPA